MKKIFYRSMQLGITFALTVGTLGISAAAEESQFPITIKHAFGETVIESKPEAVATIAWGNQDVPLALGIAPVGASEANYGLPEENNGMQPWTEEAYKALGVENPVLFDDTDGLDFEAISDVNPDIILCAYSGITEEEYNTLSEIAPVVPYAENAWETLWREQTLTEAKGLGMKKEGEELVAKTDELIKEKSEEYGINGKTGAFFFIDATDFGSFYIYLPKDPRAAYLMDLGLKFPESAAKLAENEAGIAITLSAEVADQLDDIDVIIAYGDENVLAAMQADPLLGSIPAVQKGAVVMLDSTTSVAASCNPSILSIPYSIDEYLGLIRDALNK